MKIQGKKSWETIPTKINITEYIQKEQWNGTENSKADSNIWKFRGISRWPYTMEKGQTAR